MIKRLTGINVHIEWWWLLLVLWLGVFAKPQFDRVIDDHWPRLPWVAATTLEIIPPTEEGPPMVLYKAQATRDLQSTQWTATTHFADGTRLHTRKGPGNYSTTPGSARLWTWEAFFEEGARQPPPVPRVPFKICVNYTATSLSGITKEGEPFCSEPFDPRKPQ